MSRRVLAKVRALASPWQFSKKTWESKFQAWSYAIIKDRLRWILLTAAPSSLYVLPLIWDLGPPSISKTQAAVQLMYWAGIILLGKILFFNGQCHHHVSRTDTRLMRLGVRLISVAAVVEISYNHGTTIRKIESALRWIALMALGMCKYEEVVLWFILALASSLLFDPRAFSSSFGDQLIVPIFFIGLGATYILFGLRRREWLRTLATTTVLDSDRSLPGSASRAERKHNEDASKDMHDDYFTSAEWASLVDKVEIEGEEMVKRGAYHWSIASALQPYEWIHSSHELGSGAFGRVHVVKSRHTGELCALKHTRISSSSTSEGHLLRMLKHPHIIAFADEVKLESRTHLITELCTGGSLAALIHGFGALDVEAAAWFTSNIVSALMYLHQHGISHNDLKTANCFLQRFNSSEVANPLCQHEPRRYREVVVKLGDFGSASWKRGSFKQEKLVGTPAYMAPEVLIQNASRRRIDVWALGICALEMLTGQRRLSDEFDHPDSTTQTDARAVIAHRWSMQRDPKLPPGVPRGDAHSFVQDCLRFEPARRPTCHTLWRHPFVAKQRFCPEESLAIETVRAKPDIQWISVGPLFESGLVLPRLKWRAMHWLNPAAAWRWLRHLERPFISPQLEERFHAETSQERVVGVVKFFRVCGPLYYCTQVNSLVKQTEWFTVWPWVVIFRICFFLLTQWILFGASLQQRRTEWRMWGWIVRLAWVMRLWIGVTHGTSSVVFAPFIFFLFYFVSSMVNSLAETFLMAVVMAVSLIFPFFTDDYIDAQANGLSSWEQVERRVSSALVVLCSAALCCYASWERRTTERSRFRQGMMSAQGPASGSSSVQSRPSSPATSLTSTPKSAIRSKGPGSEEIVRSASAEERA